MTPYAHHISDAYLTAYTDDLSVTLRDAMTGHGARNRIRRAFALALVRVGAWMMPDRTQPEMVSDAVIVLPKRTDHTDIRTAA